MSLHDICHNHFFHTVCTRMIRLVRGRCPYCRCGGGSHALRIVSSSASRRIQLLSIRCSSLRLLSRRWNIFLLFCFVAPWWGSGRLMWTVIVPDVGDLRWRKFLWYTSRHWVDFEIFRNLAFTLSMAARFSLVRCIENSLWLQNHFLENRSVRKKIRKRFWETHFLKIF